MERTMKKYDYLVVGAGLFGATFAYEAAKRGKRVKVIEKRDHIAGNIYTKEIDGIQVHQYYVGILIRGDDYYCLESDLGNYYFPGNYPPN